jgi:threonine dehydratase
MGETVPTVSIGAVATTTAVTLDDVLRARERIGDRLVRTPLLDSPQLSELAGARVLLKAELFQRTGSFKPRGVLSKLATLSDDERRRGVISISAGNHAVAVAFGAAAAGIDALLVMWRGANEFKIDATRAYGATVDLETSNATEALDRLRQLQEETGRVLVHPYEDPLVVAGAGTVGPSSSRTCSRSTSSWSEPAAAASSQALRRR